MDNAQYATSGLASAGAPLGAQLGVPQPTRTFDGIAEAARRLMSINGQVENILDRIQPSPRDAGTQHVAAVPPRQPHANALNDLHAQLDRLASQLDQLDKHI